jgi:uncharacterized protein
MYKKNEKLYYSPSDITCFLESPFASWMKRFSIEYPDQTPEQDPEDALMGVLARKGYAHEDALEEEFLSKGLSVIKIDGGSQEEKHGKTLSAMQAGVDVIIQARLELNQFAGYSDFLVKVPGESRLGNFHYEIWDTKLANKVKPTFLIQLCCYAEMIEAVQGVPPKFVTVALGSGEKKLFKTLDYTYYYRAVKDAFLSLQEQFSPDSPPDPADSKSWGDWSSYAEQLLLEKDHLLQVATITRGQIKKLNHAGITTMQALADSTIEYAPGINPSILQRLKSQARIQQQTKVQQQAGKSDTPCFEIISPAEGEMSGLALLPAHSPEDVFFDIEGYPLDDGGLEYLWGCTYFNESGERSFKDFWAHNKEQEKVAFGAFIQWAYERWQQDPTMHVYHYANYEIAACRKLMGRYGVSEYEVDQLLRNEVFVDLYKIVKGGLLLGEPRYSIKNVEHLYRGKRDTEVGSGGDSVVVYDHWRESHSQGAEGDTWETSKTLKDIRDYNIDDCNSTQELVVWLRKQQQLNDIAFIGKSEVVEPEEKEEITERIQLRDRLLKRAQEELVQDVGCAALTVNLAWLLEFHRRESKPVFWRMFDRLGLSHVELLDDLDCLALCERTEREPFKPTPRARNLAYEYHFDPAQEFKGAAKHFYLLGVESEGGSSTKVTFIKDESDLDNGIIVVQAKTEPPAEISLVPDEFVNPNPIPQAINASVTEYEQGTLSKHQSAIIDFLTRSKPRFKSEYCFPDGGSAIAPSHDSEIRLKQIIQAAKHLDSSYLTIQGPPGAGKSYTGQHIIAELVKSGARVGIASNSHKAINNLLLSTAEYCKTEKIQATFACTRDTEPKLAEYDVAILKNNQLANHTQQSCVLGTTAWGFAREDMAGQLDYLFVDEAGQVAVANLLAMSRSSRNLILMGDQMQLGQPSQGTHPAESGLSVLDYSLHETPTISDDMGVFLGTTYRMHSKVNQFISDHIYEGKLEAHPDNDHRVVDVPPGYTGPLDQQAGIVFVPVEHEGNTQASDEEVAKIKELAEELLGRIFHTGKTDQPTRSITWDDMLFVAPYNHQVNKLRQALGENAKIGSVDKFQGQEAPVVFLSMCTSDASESLRGLDFLFDRRRINVAISRAQTLAIVIANPAIGRAQASSVDQLKLVNLFDALVLE